MDFTYLLTQGPRGARGPRGPTGKPGLKVIIIFFIILLRVAAGQFNILYYVLFLY